MARDYEVRQGRYGLPCHVEETLGRSAAWRLAQRLADKTGEGHDVVEVGWNEEEGGWECHDGTAWPISEEVTA